MTQIFKTFLSADFRRLTQIIFGFLCDLARNIFLAEFAESAEKKRSATSSCRERRRPACSGAS
jgi:hypothetical protein